ncbi:uncharacterized protein EV420DRAFT_1621740 [Desarmillaria tabescens]|uniref:DUF6589 domain-containing protein n=1 Tax=Armillaria tabescens TaxID=1929756 RepID=A0AA39JZV6_ARMTA|nr:uncharacterized protein EV420DRAFT_1621740 [Desarmillaria tabescens]KAK0451960.1 hypothetical protein EV420DRAFT_1621740 [Desarmillaria tabescens]
MVLALKNLITWCRDQLTIDQLCGLSKYHAMDSNSYDQLDWMLLVFGWFYLMMAFAQSLHKQYLGTTKGKGLQTSFNIMKQKGLLTMLIRGPFHHNLDEALKHIAEAHIMHGSSNALNAMDLQGQDMLQYLLLDDAIKHGDVGMMEDFLPQLLFCFQDGGNSKYMTEVLELLQALHWEWPEEVKNFVHENCWVLNMAGKSNSYVAIDQVQEYNIKDINVTYHSEGPNIKWDYLKKLHPAIPVIWSLSEHIEKQFGTLTRGKKHTIPKKKKDVETLTKLFWDSKYHDFKARQKLQADKNKARDYIGDGITKLWDGQAMANWVKN